MWKIKWEKVKGKGTEMGTRKVVNPSERGVYTLPPEDKVSGRVPRFYFLPHKRACFLPFPELLNEPDLYSKPSSAPG